MRIVNLRLRCFRRFVDAEINLDAPVVAVVGPNEAGKTSVLDALVQARRPTAIQQRDITRHGDPQAPVLEVTFLLSSHEVEAFRSRFPNMPDARWLRVTKHATGEVLVGSDSPLPQELQAEVNSLLPDVLAFTDSDRSLRTEYNLQDTKEWNNAVRNLAQLAGFSIDELAKAAVSTQHEDRQDMLMQANALLSQVFDASWSQSDLSVSLNIIHPAQLQVYVTENGGPTLRLADRSDGLRAFVALVAFLEAKNLASPPILVVDEAENHLHWDAQADLINLFHSQDRVEQIIYSTHSPGCLPHDLGHGVRAVLPDPDSPHHSTVENWIWESSPGFRPLLLRMGASTAAMTPHRFAVMTEGIADFILLPSLLRDATGKAALTYQVVPGIAQATSNEIRQTASESDIVFYLVDGDDGGRGHAKKIRRAVVGSTNITSLPEGVTLEDLVSAEILQEAIQEQLRRSGHKLPTPRLPDSGRSAFLKEWCEQNSIEELSKRGLASRVLEIWAKRRLSRDEQLVEERHRPTLQAVDQELLAAFGE